MQVRNTLAVALEIILADGGQGTAIGAAAGTAAGLATVLLSRGPDLILEPGT
jgi:hypothetical protein